jgi:diguanylate cyclase (GGDEF)-like protein
MILGAGALFYMHPKESLFVIAVPAVSFVIGLKFFHYDSDVIRVYATNITIAAMVIYFVPINLFLLKIKDLYLQKELEAKNKLLEEKSKLDQMTGLYTHTEILDILSTEIERAKRYGSALTVLLMDIDNFKKINDEHGHLYGDAVILAYATIIKDNIRTNDYAGRYGGDEFLILLPSADLAGAEDLYGRLSDALLLYGLQPDEKITISAGISTYKPRRHQ